MKKALRIAIVLGTMVMTFVACFGKPGDPGGNNGNRDGGVDAKVFLDAHVDAAIDAKVFMDAPPDAPSTCDMVHRDDFNTGMMGSACSTWGTATYSGASTGVRIGGVLEFQAASAQSMPNEYGQCDSNTLMLSGVDGTSIQMVSFSNASTNSKMWFNATLFTNTVTYKLELVQTLSMGLQIQVVCPPPNATLGPHAAPAFPFYVRWRGTTTNPGGTGTVTMHAEYSSNGQNPWLPIDTCVSNNQNLGSGAVEMGTSSGSGNTVTGTFDNWNIQSCLPP